MTTRRIVIVGNGPVEGERGGSIDAADLVIRFNEPSQAAGSVGRKTDILFLVNSGKSIQGWLSNPRFLGSAFVADAKRIILPHHPSIIAAYHPKPNLLSRMKGRRADWTWAAIDAVGGQGKEVTVLSPQFYEESCAELGISKDRMRQLFPSTGFLGIRYALSNFPTPEWQVEICGFGWKGWKRHDWKLEKDWADRQLASGRMAVLA